MYKPKKYKSLACGTDTISHRHIIDLGPSIFKTLQKIIDKPLNGFHNIQCNFTKLISKAVTVNKENKEKLQDGKKKQPEPEKAHRPIVETNILAKYGPVRIFANELRKQIIPKMFNNQYSFSGKGCPMAIVKILDHINWMASLKLKTIIVLWDFSNAFCTFDHNVLMKIIKRFNIPKNLEKLIPKYLNQSSTIVRMNDSNGYYKSNVSKTSRGSPQGQIGADFMFAMANNAIQPIIAENEKYSQRVKYVDDFTDTLGDATNEGLLKLLKQNEEALLRQATSIGLKLNDDKTKLLPINCDNELLKKHYDLVTSAKTLGVIFESNPKPFRGKYITTNGTVELCLKRLNAACCIVKCSRKIIQYLPKRIEIATSLVWAAIYDLGVIYCYSSINAFHKVEVCIKKVIKSAGLNWMTRSDLVYKLSTVLDPTSIAIKQIIQMGLKQSNIDEIRINRYRVRRNIEDQYMPFQNMFSKEFNKIPLIHRKFIIENYDLSNKPSIIKIKDRLKMYFMEKLYSTNKPMKKCQKIEAIFKNRYMDNKRKQPKSTVTYIPEVINIITSLSVKRKVSENDVVDYKIATTEIIKKIKINPK